MKNSHTEDDNAHDVGLDPSDAPIEPAFEVGTRVKLRTAKDGRYKRRPEYAENAEGVIKHVRGAYEPPAKTSKQTNYEYLYSVEFSHKDIWGENHPESNGSVVIDIWETPLKKVT